MGSSSSSYIIQLNDYDALVQGRNYIMKTNNSIVTKEFRDKFMLLFEMAIPANPTVTRTRTYLYDELVDTKKYIKISRRQYEAYRKLDKMIKESTS